MTTRTLHAGPRSAWTGRIGGASIVGASEQGQPGRSTCRVFPLAHHRPAVYCLGAVGKPKRARSDRSGSQQPELPLTAAPKSRGGGGILDPEHAAKRATARRAKPGAPQDHVRLVLTLELRTSLAERLSEQAIRSGKNLEAVVIDLLEAGVAKR